MHYYVVKAGYPIKPTEDDFVPEYRSTYTQRKPANISDAYTC